DWSSDVCSSDLIAAQRAIAIEVVRIATTLQVRAIVGRKDDQRILVKTELIHPLQQLSHHIVDHCHHGGEGSMRFMLRAVWPLTKAFPIVHTLPLHLRQNLP